MTDYYAQNSLWDRPLNLQEAERLSMVKTLVPEDVRTILDAGCGNGAITNHLGGGYDITGVDRSAEALKRYRHRKSLCDTASLPFPDRSFDLVICSDVLEHLKENVFLRAVRELKRVSKKYIFIISPNEEELGANQTMCLKCSTVFHMNWHVRSLTADKIASLFSEDFALGIISHFGDRWDFKDPAAAGAQRLLGKYVFNEDAVCPMCGERQGGLKPPEDGKGWPALEGVAAALMPFVRGRAYNRRCELLMLFGRNGSTHSWGKAIARMKGRQGKDIFTVGHMCPDALDVVEFSPGIISTDMGVFRRENLDASPYHAYLVNNSLMNWDELADDPEGFLHFRNNRGKDNHAVFAMPIKCISPSGNILNIEHGGTSGKEISVEVYDSEKKGYETIGKLTKSGPDRWMIDSFSVTLGPSPLNYALFRLVSGLNVEFSFPVRRIWLDSYSLSERRLLRMGVENVGGFEAASYGFEVPGDKNVYYFPEHGKVKLLYPCGNSLYLLNGGVLIPEDLGDFGQKGEGA